MQATPLHQNQDLINAAVAVQNSAAAPDAAGPTFDAHIGFFPAQTGMSMTDLLVMVNTILMVLISQVPAVVFAVASLEPHPAFTLVTMRVGQIRQADLLVLQARFNSHAIVALTRVHLVHIGGTDASVNPRFLLIPILLKPVDGHAPLPQELEAAMNLLRPQGLALTGSILKHGIQLVTNGAQSLNNLRAFMVSGRVIGNCIWILRDTALTLACEFHHYQLKVRLTFEGSIDIPEGRIVQELKKRNIHALAAKRLYTAKPYVSAYLLFLADHSSFGTTQTIISSGRKLLLCNTEARLARWQSYDEWLAANKNLRRRDGNGQDDDSVLII